MIWWEYIANIGLDAIKDKIKDPIMEIAVKKRLDEFLEKQEKLNFNCSLEEEVDFESLANYIRNDLIEDVKIRFFGDKEARGIAYHNIVSKSIQYAKSKTKISEDRAKKMVNSSINILRKFYEIKSNRELSYFAGRIEDVVIDAMSQHTESTQRIEEKIDKKMEEVVNKIESTSLLSLDHNMNLAETGQINQVGKNLSNVLKTISIKHPLYPYYGYNLKNQEGEMISIPLLEDAVTKYPPRFDISANSVRVGSTDISELPTYNVFDYSYRHQIPITINVAVANKLLGNITDPSQVEAMEIQGREMTLMPPSFPQAFPCSISMNGELVFDYLLMRTKEILEDGTIFVTNEEQNNRSFAVSFTINTSNKKMDFNIIPLTASNIEQLNYRNFMKTASKGGKVEIKELSLNVILGGGNIDSFSPSEQLESEIEFLEQITTIERHFDLAFKIPQDIKIEDHQIINYVYSIIRDGSFTDNWSNFNTKFEISEDLKGKIAEMNDITFVFVYSGMVNVELFDQSFSFPMKRVLNAAKIKDLMRLKQKVEFLDNSDTLTITLIPDETAGDNTYRDTFVEV